MQVLDTVMHGAFGEKLADHLPDRALPITTRPLQDFDVLIDRQYSQIKTCWLRASGARPKRER